jgi:hypothetical protein
MNHGVRKYHATHAEALGGAAGGRMAVPHRIVGRHSLMVAAIMGGYDHFVRDHQLIAWDGDSTGYRQHSHRQYDQKYEYGSKPDHELAVLTPARISDAPD